MSEKYDKRPVNDAMVRVEQKKLMLPVNFTEEELLKMGREQADIVKHVEDLEDQKKESAKHYGDRINASNAEVRMFARKIRDGYEDRLIECEVRLDYPEVGTKSTYRLDTMDLVRQEIMTQDEKQLQLRTDHHNDEVEEPEIVGEEEGPEEEEAA